MQFSDYLLERLKKKYTLELFKTLPQDLHNCLKRVLCLKFDGEPPYDHILQCLDLCYEKAVKANSPICPPSMTDKVFSPKIKNYIFEWNHTIGNRFR